ncbi:Glutathione S-transferase [Halotydeus destructor]|nr:Glutathione S-transferase [Halotydeus destructor]
MSTPIVGYWDVRGLGEPVRFLMYHLGVPFVDKRYSMVGATHRYDEVLNTWYEEKPNLGLDFPNLPYYIDDDVKLTQSVAIIRYLAHKHGLEGDEAARGRLAMAEQQAYEMRNSLTLMAMNRANFDQAKKTRLAALKGELDLFDRFLGHRSFVAGHEVTYVDFLWHNALDSHRLLDPIQFVSRPRILAYLDRIEALPNIDQYMKSSVYNRNVFAPWAMWGGDLQ